MFLVAGRIMWQKNIELAIDALALARQQGADARLVIAGAVDEKSQPYLEALRARCGDLPVEFEVNPTDGRLTRLFQSAAALLFTPPNEDWGIVPLEAMAAGTPVIAVNAGGPSESVLHGQTGWLLPNDAQAFAWQLHAVAASAVGRPSELIRMGDVCRKRASEFTWDHFVSRLDEVMVAVAEQRGVTPATSTQRTGAVLPARAAQSIAARSSLPASAHVLAVG
jgi:glycosyltransferase involved in cell wall biosynthesis